MKRPDLLDLKGLTTYWRIRRDREGLPVIAGRRGSVGAYDRTTLCVGLTSPRYLPSILRDLPRHWKRYQVGDTEANVLAPATDLDAACRQVRAYRRRHLSPERRQKIAATLKIARESCVARHREAEKSAMGFPVPSDMLPVART